MPGYRPHRLVIPIDVSPSWTPIYYPKSVATQDIPASERQRIASVHHLDRIEDEICTDAECRAEAIILRAAAWLSDSTVTSILTMEVTTYE